MINRYEELDSMRGLAAVAVFFGHIYAIFYGTFITKLLFDHGILRFMISGSESVILFFVLSGFVLSLPFYSKKQPEYGKFLLKRICRIYIPYIISILFVLVIRKLTYEGKISSLTEWFNGTWSGNVDFNVVKNHFLLIGTFLSNLNSVVWSLVHEMRISIIFPFLMFIILRLNWKQNIIFSLFLSLGSVVYCYLSNVTFTGTQIYSTIHYSAIFVIGALLAKHRDEIKNIINNLNKKLKITVLVSGLILYLYAHPSFVLNLFFSDINPFYRTVIDSWIVSIGASILISFSISSTKISFILKNKIINFIGQISYSLYLYHIPVLFSLIHSLNGLLPIWAICLLAIVMTFFISVLMYYLIEKPSIKLGKLITKNKREIKPMTNVKIS